MKPRFSLYLITDPSVERLLEITRAALEGAPRGSIAVQARAKGAPAKEQAELALALLPICRACEAPLLVNDRADVAKAVGADGVHLPESGLRVSQARAVLGLDALIGRSCHDREGLLKAKRDGADFATLGPIGQVPGKNPPLGVEGFAEALRGNDLPTYALGGVSLEQAAALRRVGAAGVAVIRAVYEASDPARIARALVTDIRLAAD